MGAAVVLATVFVALYAGHQVGDHVVQTDWQATNKAAKGSLGAQAMGGHLLGYGTSQAVTVGMLFALGVPTSGFAAGMAWLVSLATHGFIDRRWPVRWLQEHTGSRGFAALASHGLNGMYLTDQALHIGAMFLAAFLAAVLA